MGLHQLMACVAHGSWVQAVLPLLPKLVDSQGRLQRDQGGRGRPWGPLAKASWAQGAWEELGSETEDNTFSLTFKFTNLSDD